MKRIRQQREDLRRDVSPVRGAGAGIEDAMGEASDFVNVKLTARGEELGGVIIAGGDYHYEIKPGESVRLTRAEFEARIAPRAVDGEVQLVEAVEAKEEA